ncbi:hypothetical protein M569_02325 [Genlisea aurea]|uniref:Uncharacterized protein n=1 Tax=Genlisea aurea TaxID=192259 RepID=S8E994_9LAMI|nr:hypothetical protein M569_02325 [Genlisea aurea]
MMNENGDAKDRSWRYDDNTMEYKMAIRRKCHYLLGIAITLEMPLSLGDRHRHHSSLALKANPWWRRADIELPNLFLSVADE